MSCAEFRDVLWVLLAIIAVKDAVFHTTASMSTFIPFDSTRYLQVVIKHVSHRPSCGKY
jgi:hypothetical protein